MSNVHLLISLIFATLLLASCNTEYPQSCPASTPVRLLDADEIASDDSLPFRFPLEESTIDYEPLLRLVRRFQRMSSQYARLF